MPSVRETVAALRDNPCDCVVLDLRLPDLSGIDLLERIQRDFGQMSVPVVVYTGKELTAASTGSAWSSADLGVCTGAMVCAPTGGAAAEDVVFNDTICT